MFLVKVAAVAHGDRTTSLTILQRTSPATVLFGLGALVGMWYVLGLGGSALVAAVVRARREGRLALRTQTAIVGYGFLVGSLTSAIGALAVAIVLSGWLWWPRHTSTGVDKSQPLPSFYPMALVWAASLSLAATDTMWLPREVLTMRGGREPVVGYVLEAGDAPLVVLHDESRTVERVDSDDVTAREYCDRGTPAWWERPLTGLQESRRPNYDDCPQ
jgi:hypothetical protein